MMANQHANALPLLQQCISISSADSPNWQRAMWAIARMESVLGNYIDAANYYQLIGNNATVKASFRLQAKIEWSLSLVQTGDISQISDASSEILEVLGSVNNYETLLNFARQLLFAPAALQGLRDQVFAAGEKLALQALAQVSDNPTATLEVLFKLTRRRDDQLKFSDNIAAWENLGDAQQQWLWSTKNEFWELVSYVCTAYGSTGFTAQADALTNKYLNDPATPNNGVAILGINQGLRQIQAKSYSTAIATFTAITSRSPSQLICARGYYWMALDAIRQGSSNATVYANSILRCIGPQPGLLWYWQLEAKALCILAGFDVSKVSSQVVRYSSDTLYQYNQEIMADLASLES